MALFEDKAWDCDNTTEKLNSSLFATPPVKRKKLKQKQNHLRDADTQIVQPSKKHKSGKQQANESQMSKSAMDSEGKKKKHESNHVNTDKKAKLSLVSDFSSAGEEVSSNNTEDPKTAAKKLRAKRKKKKRLERIKILKQAEILKKQRNRYKHLAKSNKPIMNESKDSVKLDSTEKSGSPDSISKMKKKRKMDNVQKSEKGEEIQSIQEVPKDSEEKHTDENTESGNGEPKLPKKSRKNKFKNPLVLEKLKQQKEHPNTQDEVSSEALTPQGKKTKKLKNKDIKRQPSRNSELNLSDRSFDEENRLNSDLSEPELKNKSSSTKKTNSKINKNISGKVKGSPMSIDKSRSIVDHSDSDQESGSDPDSSQDHSDAPSVSSFESDLEQGDLLSDSEAENDDSEVSALEFSSGDSSASLDSSDEKSLQNIIKQKISSGLSGSKGAGHQSEKREHSNINQGLTKDSSTNKGSKLKTKSPFNVNKLKSFLESSSETRGIDKDKEVDQPPEKESKIISPNKEKKVKKGAVSLADQMRERLNAARFRHLNEQLYTVTGREAFKMMAHDSESFQVYHRGFETQVNKWPSNPVDRVIKYISKRPSSLVVADFGCGDAKVARNVPNKVHSFDLVALNEHVTACDMAKLPIKVDSVDIGVFCLSLMGTNLSDFLLEANRVIKIGGILLIAEVLSRFKEATNFVKQLEKLGFKLKLKDESNKMFVWFELRKTEKANPKNAPTVELLPCIYKRR